MLHNNMVNQLASTVELAWPNSNGKHSKVGCHENKMTGPTLDNPDENQKPNHVETTIVPQDLGEKKQPEKQHKQMCSIALLPVK